MRSAAAFVATRCEPVGQAGRFGQPVLGGEAHHQVGRGCHRDTVAGRDDQWIAVDLAAQDPAQLPALVAHRDRKSGVSGKSVSVRVYLGGRRLIKKQKSEAEIRTYNV